MRAKLLVSLLFLLALAGCYKVPDKIEPQVNYSVQDRYLKSLPAAFPPLSEEEKREEWGKEYLIAQKFSRELDLYRAITTFKRAEFLLPPGYPQRLEEIQYQIILSYYLGKRYDDVIQTFDHSVLYNANASFSAYCDLLVIMYDSYSETGQQDKALYVFRIIQHHYPDIAKKLELSTAFLEGDLNKLREEERIEPPKPFLTHFLESYDAKKKSVSKAQWANALLPGAGYLYVGQRQAALTSFLLNTLFIYAAVQFYSHGYIAAGIITTSFEMGWYFGGIYGAGEAAKYYNEWLYEKQAYPVLNRQKLFPVLMLKYGF